MVQKPGTTVVSAVAEEKITMPVSTTIFREKRASRNPVGRPPIPRPNVKIVESSPVLAREKPNALRTSGARTGNK